MTDAHPSEPALTAALLCIAQGFTLIFWGLLTWIALWAGVAELPTLARLNIPSSTLPALLWLVGAWHIYRARDISPRWNTLGTALFIAAALQVYMLPYLGWWHTTAPALYRHANVALLVAASAAGLVLIHLLALQVARRLDDQILRMETQMSFLAAIFVALLLTTLFYWSTRRVSDEIGWFELISLLNRSSRMTRATMGLMFIMPLLPPIALTWEIKQRILLWIPAQRIPSPDENA